jgi:hypothetical protein
MQSTNWEIIPYVGIGDIRFGMTRQEARVILGQNVTSFRKGPFAQSETDAYRELNVHLHYNSDDRVECVEGFGHCEVSYDDVLFLGSHVAEVVDQLVALGLQARYLDGFHVVDELGVALSGAEGIVDVVTVYSREAYDRVLAMIE